MAARTQRTAERRRRAGILRLLHLRPGRQQVQCTQLARGARPLPALRRLAASAARALTRTLTLRNPCHLACQRSLRGAHSRAARTAAHRALLGAAARRHALQQQPRHRRLLLRTHASNGAPASLLLLLLPLPPLLLIERVCVTPRGTEGRPGLRLVSQLDLALTSPHELAPQQQPTLRHAHLGVESRRIATVAGPHGKRRSPLIRHQVAQVHALSVSRSHKPGETAPGGRGSELWRH